MDRHDRYYLILLLGIFVVGFGYRVWFLRDASFDISTFLAYSSTSLLLSVISRLHMVNLSKDRTTVNKREGWRVFKDMQLSSKCWSMLLAGFIGLSIPLLIGFPLILVTAPTLLASLGFEAAYGATESLVSGLYFGNVPVLWVFTIWFIIGSAILHLEIVWVNNYFKRAMSKANLL